MSFDIFVQAFRAGDAGECDPELIDRLIAPHVESRDEEFSRLAFPDGGLDLYGMKHLSRGFMVNHVVGDQAWSLLVRIATEADLAIFAPGCPTAICREGLRGELPEALLDDVRLVSSGPELLALIVEAD